VEVKQIVDLMTRRVIEQLRSKDIALELTDSAKNLLSEKGYDPALGARPLRRTIQRMVEDPLSEKLLWKEFSAGQLVVVDAEDGEIVFRNLDQAATDIDVPPAELAGTE
jgi:ATP-dependent Clp protease ATP-binding subunit ClpC